MFEAAASALGWISRTEAQTRVNLSLASLAGETPGFVLTRQRRDGWVPTFFSASTGKGEGNLYTVLDTGLNSAGALMAREYFLDTSAKEDTTPQALALTANIDRLAKAVFSAVKFEHILCNESGGVDASGDVLPFTFDDSGGCGGLHMPSHDGFYNFSELHYSVWLAYNKACSAVREGEPCTAAPALGDMWARWQGRKTLPNFSYRNFPLLSDWPSYIVQLPFFSSSSFNSDAAWSALFASHARADETYFTSPAYFAGQNGRWGLAAGPTDSWCSVKDSGYEADMLAGDHSVQGAQGCKIFSPYALAGYLPVDPPRITAALLQLLAAGDAVVPIDSFQAGDYVLLRKSLIEPQWNQTADITLVDFSSELFGLVTLWLPDFWRTYTAHNFSQIILQ